MNGYVSFASMSPVPPGFQENHREEVTYRGETMDKVTHEKEIAKVDRVLKGISLVGIGLGAALATVGTLGGVLIGKSAGIVGKDTVMKNFNAVASGKEEVTSYEQKAATVRKAGYNPSAASSDSTSMTNYVRAHQDQLLTADGHQYILCKADSSIIFIPDGNMSKICEIRFWDLTSGNNIEDSSRLERTVRAFIVGYDNIEKQIQEMGSKQLSTSLAWTHLALDFDNSMVRAYNAPKGELELGLYTGTEVKVSEETMKEMKSFFDHNKTEGKKELAGEKVHKHGRGHGPGEGLPPDFSNLLRQQPPPPNNQSGGAPSQPIIEDEDGALRGRDERHIDMESFPTIPDTD